MTYGVGFLGIVIYIPQVLKIYTEKNAGSLSLITWLGMSIGSIIWILYGFAHRQKPIILINIALVTLQIIIVFGIFLYS